jgi:hypothetical protein
LYSSTRRRSLPRLLFEEEDMRPLPLRDDEVDPPRLSFFRCSRPPLLPLPEALRTLLWLPLTLEWVSPSANPPP